MKFRQNNIPSINDILAVGHIAAGAVSKRDGAHDDHLVELRTGYCRRCIELL